MLSDGPLAGRVRHRVCGRRGRGRGRGRGWGRGARAHALCIALRNALRNAVRIRPQQARLGTGETGPMLPPMHAADMGPAFSWARPVLPPHVVCCQNGADQCFLQLDTCASSNVLHVVCCQNGGYVQFGARYGHGTAQGASARGNDACVRRRNMTRALFRWLCGASPLGVRGQARRGAGAARLSPPCPGSRTLTKRTGMLGATTTRGPGRDPWRGAGHEQGNSLRRF